MDPHPFVFPNEGHLAWTVMVVLYPYITGIVAGTFLVSSLYYVFRLEVFKPVAQLALVTSFCFCAFATLPLLLHLHHPERAFQVMITPSTTSAIAGFGFIYNTYMLIVLTQIWLVFRPAIIQQATSRGIILGTLYRILALGVTNISDRAKAIDQWLIRALAVIGIPVACVLTGYVGFLFGAVKSNPWWSSSLMPVIFVASAIVSGFAVTLLLYQICCACRCVTHDVNCTRTLSRFLWATLAVAVSLEGLELLQLAYEAGGEWPVIQALLTEHLAFSFGTVQVLVGSLIPLVLLLLAFPRRVPTMCLSLSSCLASVLVLVQVFAMRWNVVIGGQLFSKSFRGFVDYEVPLYGREGGIAVGVILLMPLVLLWVTSMILPLWQDPTPAEN